MSSKKKSRSSTSTVSSKSTPSSCGELRTSWGWGRPSPPPASLDQFAYETFPWYIIYAVATILPASIIYYFFQFQLVAWMFGFPLLAVLSALPAFAFIVLPYTGYLQPETEGCPEKFFKFNDKSFERRYRGRKVPIETLYEAFFDGKIDLLPGLDLLDVLYERHTFTRFVLTRSHAKFFLTQFIPELLTHSRSQDVDQVRTHYDRGDDFYACFLGPSMIYTSGIFHDPEESLEQAQVNKMELVANKIHLKPGDEHLDIGCGWGTFISHCAKNYGTNSIGVTLGRNQTEWANKVAKREGVADRAKALCMDYRDIPVNTNNKKFDKITCLEMSEHVGVKYYARFVQQVKDMLKDDGIFYLQIAGLRRAWQIEDFNWGLFMGKYIFPGADASCPLGWVIDQLESGGFEIRSEETIGIHYSATIQHWYNNWKKNEAYITEKYGMRWYRLWSWFLGWSVISPEQGSASCYQIVAHKNTRKFDRKQWIAERKNYQI